MASKVANGNINPSRFVKLDTTVAGGGYVIIAAANSDNLYGISQPGTHAPPGNLLPSTTLDDGYAAVQNENIRVFVAGEGGSDGTLCWLQAGGTVTTGDELTSDSSGRGVTTTTTGQIIGARAMQSGVSGDLIKVQVLPGFPHA